MFFRTYYEVFLRFICKFILFSVFIACNYDSNQKTKILEIKIKIEIKCKIEIEN